MFKLIKLKSGWLDLKIAEMKDAVSISYLSDFLGDLLLAVLELKDKRKIEVFAELEPNNYVFRFELELDLVLISCWYEDLFEYQEDLPHTEIVKITYPDLLENVNTLFCEILLSCNSSEKKYEEEWGFEFPTEDYKLLKKILKS